MGGILQNGVSDKSASARSRAFGLLSKLEREDEGKLLEQLLSKWDFSVHKKYKNWKKLEDRKKSKKKKRKKQKKKKTKRIKSEAVVVRDTVPAPSRPTPTELPPPSMSAPNIGIATNSANDDAVDSPSASSADNAL